MQADEGSLKPALWDVVEETRTVLFKGEKLGPGAQGDMVIIFRAGKGRHLWVKITYVLQAQRM